MSLWSKVTAWTRRALTGAPSSISSESHNAWMTEQIRAYTTNLPYIGPGNQLDNITGETQEMRNAYRIMLKEPAIYAPLMAKTFAVASLDPQITPEDEDDPTEKAACDWARYTVSKSEGGWPRLIMNVLLPGQFDGFSVTEKVFDVMRPDHKRYPGFWGLKAAKDKETQHIRYKLDKYKNILGVQVIGNGQGSQTFDPADFILFTHLSIFQSPFGISALRPVYRAANLIVAAIKLRSLLLENFSGPFLVFKNSDASQVNKARSVLEAARSRGYIVIGREDDLEVMNLATTAPDQFQNAIDDLRKECSLGLRGAYLQSLESASPQGNSNAHKSQTELFDWYLMTSVCSVLTTQLLPDLIEPNYGTRGGSPTLTLGGLDPTEVLAHLQRFKAAQDLGIDVSVSQVRRLTGVEAPKDEGDKLQKPAGPGAASPGGLGGGDPFGGGFGDPAPDDPTDDPFGGAAETQFAHKFGGDLVMFASPKPGFTGQVKDSLGRTYNYVDGKRVAKATPAAKPAKAPAAKPAAAKAAPKPKPAAKPKADHEATHAKATALLTQNEPLGTAGLQSLADHLSTLPAAKLKELQAAHGLRGGKVKADHVDRLLAFATGRDSVLSVPKLEAPQPAAKPAPAAKPETPATAEPATPSVGPKPASAAAKPSGPKQPYSPALQKQRAAEVGAAMAANAKRIELMKGKEETPERKARIKQAEAENATLGKLAERIKANKPETPPTAESATADLNKLLTSFKSGNVPEAVVNHELDKLKLLSQPELLDVARRINMDATLSEKSSAKKIESQLVEGFRQVWKTSDNVRH